MAMIFGADSIQPVDTELTNGYDLFTWVMRKNGIPSFWCRNISGTSAVTAEEAEFLHRKKTKIALTFNDLTERGVSSADGTNDAIRLIQAAKALGVPDDNGVALFAAIDGNWSVSHNWMTTFSSMLAGFGYVPGFIGNTDSSKNCSFDRECGHFLQATEEVGHFGTVYGATEPKREGEPAEWGPFCPSDLTREQIALWYSGTIACNDAPVSAVYGRNESVLEYLW